MDTKFPLQLVVGAALAFAGACGSTATDNDPVEAENQTLLDTTARVPSGQISKKSRVLLGRNGPARGFDVDISAAGAYYVRIGAILAQTEGRLTVFLDDGATPIGTVSASGQGFNYYDVLGTKGSTRLVLPAGMHTLSFRSSGANIPQIETVEVSQKHLPASDAPARYADHVARLATSPLGPDYQAVKDAGQVKTMAEPRNDPKYDYCFALGVSLTYTFRVAYYFDAGTNVVLETRKADPTGSDPVLYLVSAAHPESWSWSDDDSNGGYQSRISVTIPESGRYEVLARAYNQDYPGTSDIYKNGVLQHENAVLAGRREFCSLGKTNRWLNYFTSNTSEDTMLWLVDEGGTGVGQIRAFNDDYGQPGDFNWGTRSRVHRAPQAQPLKYAIVSAFYSSGTNAQTDVYLENEDVPANIPEAFPNLKSIDAIKSAVSTGDGAAPGSYNCIAWAGGLTSQWVDPANPASPWWVPTSMDFPADYDASYNHYFGNIPPRYQGAHTYTPDNVTDANAVVDLWGSPGMYFFFPLHASVRKPGDGFAHGYDWESKLGGWERIFHPRLALGGNRYGVKGRSYRWTGSTAGMSAKVAQPTLEASVAAGLSVLESPTLTAAETGKLGSLKAAVSPVVGGTFEKLYGAWKATWSRKELALMSDSRSYAQSDEYKDFLEYCRAQGKAVWAPLFEKYLSGDFFALVPIEDLTLPEHEAHLKVIREESARERFAADGKYIVPSLKANITKFIKALLATM